MIILATASVYRQEAFGLLGTDFIAEASGIDEYFNERPENPEALVKMLAKLKAEAVARNHSSGVVIGFDSVCYFNGSVLEKPKSNKEAFERLKSMSGKSYTFYTGIHMINIDTGNTLSKEAETKAFMRVLYDHEIKKYLVQDPHFNTYAVGYDPLGHYSSTFISRIEGSYNNILRGIPLEVIVEMLVVIGYKF